MRDVKRKQGLMLTLIGSVLFYTIISLFVSFLHNRHEDPTYFHDDCPACRWEQQSQENPPDYYAISHFITAPGDSFAGFIIPDTPHICSQELFKKYPTRSPPYTS